ncbi:MAG TPA: hypothetical protein VIQ00_11560 [Chitinophagaceae bacterium]|jgi:hypothetical protein
MKIKSFFFLVVITCFAFSGQAQLQIGTLTHLKVFQDNVTVYDIKKGKEVNVIELEEKEILIDMQLWNKYILLLTSNGLKSVNKPA